jgi:epoxyqueuosine reductase
MSAHMMKLLADQGRGARIVSIEHLGELRDEIELWRTEGLLDDELYQDYMTGFRFRLPEDLPGARSIIVAATRDPLVRFHFIWKGKELAGQVPPTYVHGPEVDRTLGSLLNEHLQAAGHEAVRAILPRKLLAVRSGLARYGRNNIAYVDGMGSFLRLSVFFSTLPCDRDNWQDPRMLERCETCTACRKTCPSGAITEDRFLLQAERCIVYHNEKPSQVPFPEWISPDWHNCLVGCMICQRICPENKSFLGYIREEATFSETETGLLLKAVPLEDLPAETAEKLRSADLVGMLEELPRNLRALLEKLQR